MDESSNMINEKCTFSDNSEAVYRPTVFGNDEKIIQLAMANKKDKGSLSFLYFSAITANMVAFAAGVTFGWTSPVIPKLNGSIDPQFNPLGGPITPLQESWITGLLSLGAALGPVLSSFLVGKIGPKKTLLTVAVPIFASFVLLAFAQSINMYYVARFAMGLGAGSVFSVLPIYLSEIAQDRNRGTLGSLMGVFVSCGTMFPYVVGPFASVRYFSFLCTTPIVVFLIVFGFIIPESPVFLVGSKDLIGAELSLTRLRGLSNLQVQKELNVLIKNHADLVKTTSQNEGVWDILKKLEVRKGLLVSCGLVMVQQLSGINVVLSYMQSIFDAAGSTNISSTAATSLIGGIQILATIATSLLVDRLGRKILLSVSTFGAATSLVFLGGYFFLKQHQFGVASSLNWVPIFALILYIVCFNLGLGPLTWTVMAELFASNSKPVAAMISTFVCFMASFIICSGFPSIVASVGMASSFWFFALVAFLGLFFVLRFVPETRGKQIHEILQILRK